MKPSITKVPSSTDPIDPHAFLCYPPNYLAGEHRSEHNKNNPHFKLDEAADRAMQRAVTSNRNTILDAGDDDQITLAL